MLKKILGNDRSFLEFYHPPTIVDRFCRTVDKIGFDVDALFQLRFDQVIYFKPRSSPLKGSVAKFCLSLSNGAFRVFKIVIIATIILAVITALFSLPISFTYLGYAFKFSVLSFIVGVGACLASEFFDETQVSSL